MSASVDYRERNITRRMEKCVHFTGLIQSACAAGVRYADVEKRHEPIPYDDRGVTYRTGRSLPCWAPGTSGNLAGATCDKCRRVTREEAEAKEAETERCIVQMGEARRAIVAHVKATGKNGGTIGCPVCKHGTLGYSRASSNGHIHA